MSKIVQILQNGFLLIVYERINVELFNIPRKLDMQVEPVGSGSNISFLPGLSPSPEIFY
jgi:hypothetical protein